MTDNIDNKDKILDVLSLTKLASMLFLGVVIINTFYPIDESNFSLESSYFKLLWSTAIILAFTLIYSLWAFIFMKKLPDTCMSLALKLESLLLFILYASIIILSGGYNSDYKVIFLFLIITSTLQLGLKFGISITVISSAFILGMNLLAPVAEANTYFSRDIILCSIFLCTTLPLGYYEMLRKEYIYKLEERANKDALTRLYNHRYFHNKLNKSFNNSLLTKQKIALLFIDIDYFKDYNDSFGHQEGDRVLKQISEILNHWASDDVLVFRYGGDEFAIIIEELSNNDAFEIGESIRKRIEETAFIGEEHLPLKKITVSIGVAIKKDGINSVGDMIKYADDALYRAKFFSKNRVEIFSSFFEALNINIEDEDEELIASIKTLISIINVKDKYTYGHVERVVVYVKDLADQLGISDEDKKTLIYGAYMHDVGKISIDGYLLNKKTPLTEEEWEIFKTHPNDGVEIIKPLSAFDDVIPIVKYHHERYDGRGYPEGLKGEEIPFLTRILIVADSFDAMTSARPYKKNLSYEEAIADLRKHSGTQFDPEIVEAFVKSLKKST